MNKIILLIISLMMLIACGQKGNKETKTDAQATPVSKNEKNLQDANDDFSRTCNEKGLTEAFKAYASEDVILMTEGALPVTGMDSIITFLSERKEIKTLNTQPDKVRVSSGNDLGYVFGSWRLVLTGKGGVDKSMDGHYSSVWHMQSDNQWKFELFCMTSNNAKANKPKNK